MPDDAGLRIRLHAVMAAPSKLIGWPLIMIAECRTREAGGHLRGVLVGLVLGCAACIGHPAWAQTTWLLSPSVDSYPSPSPDGRALVFQSTRNGRTALYIADSDGSRPRLWLDTGTEPSSPAWSPDGKSIAFADQVQGDSEIFIMAVDGRVPQRLTAIRADDSHPAWSADSRRIFFSSNRHTEDQAVEFHDQVHDIFSMRSDGTDLRQHTDCRAVCTYPAPSPDGKSLAFRKLLGRPGNRWNQSLMGFDSEVMVSAIDGSAARTLSDHPAFDGWPAWSPDGRWIAFASNRVGRVSSGQIYLIRPDGSGLAVLTSGDWSNTQPRWSADSTTVFSYRHRATTDPEVGAIGVTRLPAE